MIIFTGAPTMTMRPTGNPTDALGVVRPRMHRMGHRPQAILGRLETMRRLQRMIQAIRPGIFSMEHACLFGGLLACLFQRLLYAASMGRRYGRVVDPRKLNHFRGKFLRSVALYSSLPSIMHEKRCIPVSLNHDIITSFRIHK
jgi:hypothetical protein